MPIDPKDISTVLTLELDEEEISIKSFLNAFESFMGLVNEIEKTVGKEGFKSHWLVKVYPGSAGIGIFPTPGSLRSDQVNEICSILFDGLKTIEKGERPANYSDSAINYGIKLSGAFGDKAIYPKIRIWHQNNPSYTVTRGLAENAKALLSSAYQSEGTVDGYLEKLNAHGKFEFVVYDAFDQHAITCDVGPDMLSSAWKSFNRRVEVEGVVSYRADGKPTRVKAKKIVPFPGKDEVPSLAEMRDIFLGRV
ncbi:MAG: hypothetical protein OEV94_00345 [Deltaproteobacteria bacterium]|nr:hypothetical protein [Deltaproteobacteria bacterium]